MSCLLQLLHQWTQRPKPAPSQTSGSSSSRAVWQNPSSPSAKFRSPGGWLQKEKSLILKIAEPMSKHAGVICKRCIIRSKCFHPSAAQALSIASTRLIMTNMIIASLYSMFDCLLARKYALCSLAWLGNSIFFKDTPTKAEVFGRTLCGELVCFELPWCWGKLSWSGIFIVWCPGNEQASVLPGGASSSELSPLICRWQW